MNAIGLVNYSLRSLRAHWGNSLVALLGIAGAVCAFTATLALQRGFRATLTSSARPENAMIRRAGSINESDSVLDVSQAKIIEAAPGVDVSGGQPSVSPEAVTIGSFKLVSPVGKALVQVRGVTSRALAVHRSVRVASGRFLQAGLAEMVVGRSLSGRIAGCEPGAEYSFAGRSWRIVGIIDSQGSAFDSEVWIDLSVLNQTFRRPAGTVQSIAVRLTSPTRMSAFRSALAADPRLQVLVEDEVAYYGRQARVVSRQISILGAIVAGILAVGAIFGALNIAYSSVASRLREIAILRALGFRGTTVALCFVSEALLLSLLGGLLGCAAAVLVNGHSVSTINWQTLSDLTFTFRITRSTLLEGLLFAFAMGLIGGLPPAVRAARVPVASGLRGL